MSTRASAASGSASPSTRTVAGSTVISSISKPAAGVPVTTGDTGSVRVSGWENTRIEMRAVVGDTSAGLRASPTASTGIRATSSSTSIPEGWITTSARAATTWSTIVFGPLTVTVLGVAVSVPTWRPSGTSPRSISTGTILVMSGSSWTVTMAGVTSRIWISELTEVTSTGTSYVPPWVMPDRSIVARNVSVVGWSVPSGAK